MTKKIFRAILLGTIAVLVFTTVMLSGIMYRYMTQVSERQLRTQLNLASRGLTLEGTKYFRSLNDENVRITWIDRNGKVLYDSSRSDVSGMENHRDRKEVQEALQKGYGESERYSTTLTEKMLYAARRQPDGTVLRMSVSQYSVWMLLVGMIQPFVIIIIVAVLLSLLLASRLSKRVVKPLNDVDLDHPLENEGCDEIAPILRKIDYQQRQLARQEQSLARQQDELNTILQNMAEGMILLRRGGKIISINNPAAEILGITGDHTGESLLQICRNLELEELVRKGLDGTPAEQVLALESGRYQVQVMPVREDKEVRGVTVVLFDVTDRELAEQMRREFTANVSHELKTPLHAISGYAELMHSGVVREEDIHHFSGKIYHEAQRTIRLVEDIISLSHLDESPEDLEFTEVHLLETAKDVSVHLAEKASERDIEIVADGEDAVMEGNPSLLATIITNLADNAVKYGRSGGLVRIRVEDDNDSVHLTVKDNGIGIPKEDQKRIFERFYRVDKSHSRDVGGTGLGLSIVKHGVLLHHGTISLQSEVGKGTEIRITFPKKQTEE